MIDRLLVTLDGSELSEAVLPSVARLVEGGSAAVTLLRVVKPQERAPELEATPLIMASPPDLIVTPEVHRRPTPDTGTLLSEAERYLSRHAEALSSAGASVTVKAVVADDPVQAILNEAEGHELIAMATHGRSGLARMVLGSVASAVLQRSSLPLLVVKPQR